MASASGKLFNKILKIDKFLRTDISDDFTGKFLNLSNDGATLTFDEKTAPDGYGIKRITCNDGGGNFNIRGGSYYEDGEKYTSSGDGATHIMFTHEGTDGQIELRTAIKSENAGDDITYINKFSVTSTENLITINGNKVWHEDNDGVGSGLDADLVRGKEPAQATDTEVLKTDDYWIKNQCTAWVRFDGTDVTILDSYNIASITKISDGKYEFDFENEMDNTNYIVAGNSDEDAEQDDSRVFTIPKPYIRWETTGCRIHYYGDGGGEQIPKYGMLLFFGGKS